MSSLWFPTIVFVVDIIRGKLILGISPVVVGVIDIVVVAVKGALVLRTALKVIFGSSRPTSMLGRPVVATTVLPLVAMVRGLVIGSAVVATRGRHGIARQLVRADGKARSVLGGNC